MKIVIAPDKFKGSLTGFEYCSAVSQGIRRAIPDAEIVSMPLADGGDGTIDVVQHYTQGDKINLSANDPLFRPLQTAYVFSKTKSIAFLEMAEISGLKLLHETERNCMHTTSLGFGELIVDAIEHGAKELILGIGGSATNDGGMGMATALGFRFLDEAGHVLEPIGRNLARVRDIDVTQVHPKLNEIRVKVACDVSNPLYGPHGAAQVYGRQKGASPEEIIALDEGMRNFAQLLRHTFDIDVQQLVGAGAAGGLGAGTHVFLNAELVSGIELIKEMANFEDVIADADWIITGEGQLDSQTLSGKTIAGVLSSAKKNNIPVAALCGAVTITPQEQQTFGLDYAISIVKGISSLDDAMASSYENLVDAAYNFAKVAQWGG